MLPFCQSHILLFIFFCKYKRDIENGYLRFLYQIYLIIQNVSNYIYLNSGGNLRASSFISQLAANSSCLDHTFFFLSSTKITINLGTNKL